MQGPHFVVEGHERHVIPFPGGGQAIIGRAPESTVWIAAEHAASRNHAIVYREGDGYFVKDLTSRNGTFVDGTPVAESARLSDGSRITIGSTSIRFHTGDAEET
jgi:pSer/pThr/pTyr-binding forkhead associated (FHA) protein